MNQKELSEQIRDFCEERDWDQFHNLKDLSIGLSTEANELLQLFRFKNETQCVELFNSQPDKITHELADIYYYLLRIADLYDIDLNHALEEKMKLNEQKYPVSKVKGKNLKYDEFE